MAFFEMHFRSELLKKAVAVNVILPELSSLSEEKPLKTLYLLHGLAGDYSVWMRCTSIERYALERNIAVVMPDVGRSWYTDTAYGGKYFSFVTEELPAVCRGYFKAMSARREDNFVAGLSMGGYGAIKAALRCPEKFGGCASLSGAFDVWSYRRMAVMDEWRGIFGYDLQDPAELEGTKHDICALAEKNKEENVPFPKLFMWCGESDNPSLLGANRRFHEKLEQLGVSHVYKESEGNHSWKWWDLHIQPAMDYLLKAEE